MYPRCYYIGKKDLSNTSGMYSRINIQSFVYSPVFSLTYRPSKITVIDCCKLSFEFLFPTTISLLKLSGRGKDKSKDVYNLRSESLLKLFS